MDYCDLATTLARQTWTGRPKTPAIQHAIWWDTPLGSLVPACCGVLIYRHDAVVMPTCAACQAMLERYERWEIGL